MSVEANKAQTRQIIDQGWNKGNMDALDDLISSDFVNYTASNPNETRDGFKQRVQMIRTAFPDWQMTAPCCPSDHCVAVQNLVVELDAEAGLIRRGGQVAVGKDLDGLAYQIVP